MPRPHSIAADRHASAGTCGNLRRIDAAGAGSGAHPRSDRPGVTFVSRAAQDASWLAERDAGGERREAGGAMRAGAPLLINGSAYLLMERCSFRLQAEHSARIRHPVEGVVSRPGVFMENPRVFGRSFSFLCWHSPCH